jgi:hypothetical protein
MLLIRAVILRFQMFSGMRSDPTRESPHGLRTMRTDHERLRTRSTPCLIWLLRSQSKVRDGVVHVSRSERLFGETDLRGLGSPSVPTRFMGSSLGSRTMLTAHEPRHAGISLECAGRAQRRRRFGMGRAFRSRSQSGVALRLPPHSIGSSVLVRFMERVHGRSTLGSRSAWFSVILVSLVLLSGCCGMRGSFDPFRSPAAAPARGSMEGEPRRESMPASTASAASTQIRSPSRW